MLVTLSIPEEAVGDVIGDLNSRRGHPHGMEPVGSGITEVKAGGADGGDALVCPGSALDHGWPR